MRAWGDGASLCQQLPTTGVVRGDRASSAASGDPRGDRDRDRTRDADGGGAGRSIRQSRASAGGGRRAGAALDPVLGSTWSRRSPPTDAGATRAGATRRQPLGRKLGEARSVRAAPRHRTATSRASRSRCCGCATHRQACRAASHRCDVTTGATRTNGFEASAISCSEEFLGSLLGRRLGLRCVRD